MFNLKLICLWENRSIQTLLKNIRKDAGNMFPYEITDSKSLNSTKEFIFLILNHLQKYGKKLLFPTGRGLLYPVVGS